MKRTYLALGLSLGGLVAVFGGIAVAIAMVGNSLSGMSFNLDLSSDSSDVRPIPIPPSACPSLRLVSVAAKNAGAPWSTAFEPSTDWKRFSSQLSGPLASLDAALGAAVPNNPKPVAQDLLEVRRRVEIGRVELSAAHSVQDYTNRSGVFDGYMTLTHASALVGDACGFEVAPPIP